MAKSFGKLGIVGGGLMGRGIAEVAICRGISTVLVKQSGKGMDECKALIHKNLQRAVSKKRLSEEDADAAMKRLEVSGELKDLSSADIVIESIIEDLATKQNLFQDLIGIVSDECVLASNTSTLKISDLAPVTARSRTIGLHFFSPVPAMKLVELAYLPETAMGVRESASGFVDVLGKSPIPVEDSTGFIVNRLLVPLLLGAIDAYSKGLASAEYMDSAMKLGCSHPAGPLLLSDLIGLDIVLSMAELLSSEFQDARFQPPPLLRTLVAEGKLGKKSGMGIYDHSQRPPVPNAELWARIGK